jgi:hypothetical protein
MLLCGNFTFRGLGRVDQVKNEDAHDEGAEGVEEEVAEAHRCGGRLTHRRRALGLFRLAAVDSRPPKRLAAAAGH